MTRILLIVFSLVAWLPDISGQPGLSFDLKKPQKYEEKKLASEKTDEKKFTLIRRFTQNGVTKFNWHFNASEKLRQVLERAKAQHQDDYTQLLSFYNYDLENTARDKGELDSVIYKANAGILIHDLRNSWIDNLYMLMGQAYYFKKEFDTAYFTFQYINYAFSPKEKDGYDIPIGSNATEGGNAFTISTKESDNVFKKIWTSPPSRNESFIWQIRTFLARNETAEAAGLIQTLKNDPNFPERLQTSLYEVQALWFYQQQISDSAAIYLEKALDNAENREERARWEYLIAQLYERAGQHERAEEFYNRTIRHTLNPVLEVYARLNAIRQNKGNEKAIQENIDDLVKMAKRDRYTNYRDIIYFTAAQIELERNNIPGAKAFLLKATQTGNGDALRKTRAFLLLAQLSFEEKNYPDAKRFYDSVNIADPSMIDQEVMTKRKEVLAAIVAQLEVIDRQDSLQRLASMPEEEREAFIRKLVKQLRKQQGLSDDESLTGGSASSDPNNAPVDLFNSNAKGDFYFYNNSVKSKGFTAFKAEWGNRPNVDNWRRMSAVNKTVRLQKNVQLANDVAGKPGSTPTALTYEELLNNVPLSPEALRKSSDSVENARYLLGKAYMEGLEDYPSAIATYEAFIEQFSYSDHLPEVLFNLHYCYIKTGQTDKAAAIARDLNQKFAGSEYDKILSNPSAVSEDSLARKDMTERYDRIYNLFIEGSFEEALAQKKIADSLYDKNYWTPQLLYIESVYYIRQRNDRAAIKVLEQIMDLYPTSPLTPKARVMIDVLGRRKEIETYLTNLEIERPAEDSAVIVHQPAVSPLVPVRTIPGDSVKTIDPATVPPVAVADPAQPTVQKPQQVAPPPVAPPVPPVNQPVTPPVTAAPEKPKDSLQSTAAPTKYILDTAAAHYVVLVMDKVDPVYVTEARNAFIRYNRDQYYNKPIDISNTDVTQEIRLMLMNNFSNAAEALEYTAQTSKAAPRDIVPWLPASKYYFIIITQHNLEVLKNLKDINAYRQFLSQSFPGKF